MSVQAGQGGDEAHTLGRAEGGGSTNARWARFTTVPTPRGGNPDRQLSFSLAADGTALWSQPVKVTSRSHALHALRICPVPVELTHKDKTYALLHIRKEESERNQEGGVLDTE